jgi:CRP-like cAMP-binding protein
VSDHLDRCFLWPRNEILAAMPPQQLARLRPKLEPVELVPRQILHGAHTPIAAVHFIESGMVSLVARLERGGAVEVGIIGREGMVGLPLALGVDSSPDEALVQTGGIALRMRADHFREELDRSPALVARLLRYECAFHTQVAQTAACNGRHPLEKRLARWLLMAHDRCEGRALSLTQDMLATMLGVRRAGITSAVGALQRSGIIAMAKGQIMILDRWNLERAACECYAAVRQEYEKLLGPTTLNHCLASPADEVRPIIVIGPDAE